MSVRHIVLSVDGGLGDHVTAEPAIRYLRQHFLHNDDVHIACHFPRVFEHLDIPTHLHNTFDTSNFEVMWTFFHPESPVWQGVCFLACNMVDFHSMMLMQRQLPLNDREIKLLVKERGRASLYSKLQDAQIQNMVVVHAGKSRSSKTFPLAWWQEVVDGLSQSGFTVCLIGKNDLTNTALPTGVLPVRAPEHSIDLRDKLSLGELFALLEAAPILLTNDSSPVQIAGAFDNWVVMVATIKEPSLVLPYRSGTTMHKTKALYKKLLAEELFNTLDLHTVNIEAEIPDWNMYLPEPKKVVEEIVAIKKLR
jgi:ADP-heptose:LPS heptosyltransferase